MAMTKASHRTTFDEALRRFQRGQLAAAEKACRTLLERDKRDVNT